MSEKTPENTEDQVPRSADPLEPQVTEEDSGAAARNEKSISAEAIVNAPPTTEISETVESHEGSPQSSSTAEGGPETVAVVPSADAVNSIADGQINDVPVATEPGQFRTKPMDLDVPFGAQGRTEPTREYPWNETYVGGAAPSQPGQQPTRQYEQATRQHPQPAPQYGQPTRQHPQATRQYQPSQPAVPQPLNHPAPPGPHGGPQPSSGPYALPNADPGAPPHRGAVAAPDQSMPLRTQRQPRRQKPKPESLSVVPVTGSMPLTHEDVTEIPADGPVEWPRRPPGAIGVANLVLSAIMAVVWAWIPIGLLITGISGIFALGLGVLALLVWVVVQQGANVYERYRAELIYADRIPVPTVESSTRPSGFARFLHNRWLQVKSGSFWRSTAHHYIKMLFGVIIVGGAAAGICAAIVGVFGAINPQGISSVFPSEAAGGVGRLGIAVGALIVMASSLAILWFAPYLDRALDRSLLSPARTAALQEEVTELDKARMAGIDAARAERLRIERDLHDGAQPRLVALTMTLGMAKSKIDTDPSRAKELVAEAHAEAKGIVNELRQLARGIHPAVLTDRGLDAAVSALAGRSVIPVDVDVRLEGRIDREAEAVAYFVVAESLTNITKHSGATHARVFIAPVEAGVQIVITDNGHGGARVDRSGRHTGIAGLIDRVEAARGTLNLTSPAGGPTTVVVEVPCAS